jgi:hypothetical protein
VKSRDLEMKSNENAIARDLRLEQEDLQRQACKPDQPQINNFFRPTSTVSKEKSSGASGQKRKRVDDKEERPSKKLTDAAAKVISDSGKEEKPQLKSGF